MSVAADRGEVVGVAVSSPADGRALARTVAGLEPPLAGRVVANGDDVTAKPPTGRRIGYIPAGGGLLPHLSVVDNITYRLDPRQSIRGLVDDGVVEITTQLELVGVQSRLPHTLTPEQRLRAAIARAVLHDPAALVVDMPAVEAVALRHHGVFTQVHLPAGDRLAVLVCTDDGTLLGRLDRYAKVTAGT